MIIYKNYLQFHLTEQETMFCIEQQQVLNSDDSGCSFWPFASLYNQLQFVPQVLLYKSCHCKKLVYSFEFFKLFHNYLLVHQCLEDEVSVAVFSVLWLWLVYLGLQNTNIHGWMYRLLRHCVHVNFVSMFVFKR